MTLAASVSIPSPEEALERIETALRVSEADGCEISVTASTSALSRFSENQISQNISRDRLRLAVTSYYGRQSATAATSELDPDAIAATVRTSETLARVAPEDPEWVPLLEPQDYGDRLPAFDAATAQCSPLARGELIQQACQRSTAAETNGSGTLSTSASLVAIGNSAGLRVADRLTDAEFSFSARLGTGSSWNRRCAEALSDLPVEEIVEKVVERAIASQSPRELSPGTYPVIFDAAALADLLPWVIGNLDARAADEGRSFMSAEGGGNRVGEPLFSPLVQIRRDPVLLHARRFCGDGMPNTPLDLVRDGVPQTLSYSRYWAQQQGATPTGSFSAIAMDGSDRTLNDLIAASDRAILVSRAWYVRYVNPRTLEVTGMTRDGTFWIENGEIAYPIKNLRFNQSLPDLLGAIEALSVPQRFGSALVPGARVAAVNFSSSTDSI